MTPDPAPAGRSATALHPAGLVITADDFGLAPEVNAAVEQAHSRGILTAASLMVGAPAAADAVAIARRFPTLGVGLHLVLTDGKATLTSDRIPGLVDAAGRFRGSMAGTALRMAASAAVRKQLAAEIEAQFAAFQATGLPLDHVNAHRHFHVSPVIGRLVFEIGRRFGMRALRIPAEPRAFAGPTLRSRVERVMMRPLAAILSRRAAARRVAVPDAVIGIGWSGAMTVDRLVLALRNLPPGLVEIYLHPATADRFPGSAMGYGYRAELDALLSPAAAAALAASGRPAGRFADFAPRPTASRLAAATSGGLISRP